MLIKFPYGGEMLEMKFPDNTAVLRGTPYPQMNENSVSGIIKDSFRRFEKLFNGKKITVIVNDATRRLPTSKILRILLELIPVDSLEFLVAAGTHRAPAEDELDIIFGEHRKPLADRIFIHDCYDTESLVSLGTTTRGAPVEINRKLAEAEAVICVNSVEPHFFAGYTGGRKSLVPGLAGFKTISANHSHAVSISAESLNLKTNPVHLDLEEAAALTAVMPIFSIQLICFPVDQIVGLFCGALDESFQKACEKAGEIYSIPVKNRYDIVFAIGEPPLDANLYQLQKAQEHAARAVADGGILVVVGACPEGVGSPYFMELADDYPTPESALSEAGINDRRFGIHKLIKTARSLRRIKIWYVTKLDDKTIRKVYFEHKKSPTEALKDALDYFGDSVKIAVLRDACYMVPVFDEEGER